ncbi:MAG: enoyl-CoA hydratase/isomerase family protein [Actinomycetota bacterium]|nr:enoyl-CoA hydratase/isomerase family protein [Actinomycetota bacterium]
MQERFGDVTVEVGGDHVAVVEIHRPPNNFFDIALIASLADAYRAVDDEPEARAIVLCSEGRHFCAGADFSAQSDAEPLGRDSTASLYAEAVKLFSALTPVVAAVQGAAVGGGLGLACAADLRIACPEARFAANFSRLGFHQGFGLSVTLPRIIGDQRSLELLLTGRRITGEEAAAIGLCDRLCDQDQVRPEAQRLAGEIAAAGPLAVQAIRATQRGDLAERVRLATRHEDAEQVRLRDTEDFAEGIAASAERRQPVFKGR